MEFATPEALKTYLGEHPRADKSKHWVTDKGNGKGKSEPERKYKSKPLAEPAKAARVGIPGDAVLPPPKLPRLQNLRDDEKHVEALLNDLVEKDPAETAREFSEIAKADNWVFETDAAKSLMPQWTRPDLAPDERGKPVHPERAEFRGKYNAVIHQAANAIVKKAFLSRLDDIAEMPEGDRKILVTSGGVAAGKGSILAAKPELKKSVAATWDAAGEQNATENEWLMQECKKRGIKPTFVFVAADPKVSWPGVIDRALKIGRMVDAQLFADSYAIGAKNFKAFHDKHKDDADFIFGERRNRSKEDVAAGKDPVEVIIGDSMPENALKLDPGEIYDYASKYIEDHKADVPNYIYDGATIGRRVWKN
jgi:hypothetical protein